MKCPDCGDRTWQCSCPESNPKDLERIEELEAENARLKVEHDDMVRIRERMYQRDCQHRAALLKAEDILGFYATGGHDQGGYAEEALAEIRTAKGQL